jgi:diguanylate cyclase (GGDEF)-like protein/PAS domain S-box-containing protein
MAIQSLQIQGPTCPVANETACRYEGFFNHVPVSIAVIDPQTNRYLEVNQTLCDRLQYSREEMLRATVSEINPRFQPTALAELARGVEANQVVQFYNYQTTRAGDELEVLMTVTPIYRDGFLLLHCVSMDVTAQVRAERQFVDSERRFRETFEQAAVGIAHVAVDGTWLKVNHRFCDIVGYSEEELRQLKFQDITHPDDLEPDWAKAKALLRGEITTYSIEKRYIRKDHDIVWVNLTVSVARDELGNPEYFISVVEDIRGRKQVEAERDELIRTLEEQVRRRTDELERLSMTDALTGIANRRRVDQALATEWARGMRSGKPLSTIVVDVDHFKSLNDHRGHAYADQCMIAIADTFKRLNTRSSDLVGRYGGDEFVFLLPETDRVGAERLARKAKAAIKNLAIANPGAPSFGILTLSQGIATAIPTPENAARELLENADRAMYSAKRRGRNRIAVSSLE